MLRVQFTVLPPHCGGMCKDDGTILINTANRDHPHRVRYMISALVHELTHWVLDRLWGVPSNPYESYCQEVWCYRMQFVSEVVMGMSYVVDCEKGAILSVADFISQMRHPELTRAERMS